MEPPQISFLPSLHLLGGTLLLFSSRSFRLCLSIFFLLEKSTAVGPSLLWLNVVMDLEPGLIQLLHSSLLELSGNQKGQKYCSDIISKEGTFETFEKRNVFLDHLEDFIFLKRQYSRVSVLMSTTHLCPEIDATHNSFLICCDLENQLQYIGCFISTQRLRRVPERTEQIA